MPEQISALVVDDEIYFRDGIELALTGAGDIRVIPGVGDPGSGYELIRAERPDVVLLDLVFRTAGGAGASMGGIQLLRRLHNDAAIPALALLTSEPSAGVMREARMLGARGMIDKGDLIERDAVVGLVRALAAGEERFAYDDPAGAYGLTPREIDVLHCLRDGMGTEQIAASVIIGEQHAKNLIRSIGAKLGVSGRYEILAKAYREGLVTYPRAQ